MARAIQRPAARRDFIIHNAYLIENAGLDTACRFRRAVERSYADLAASPGLGVQGKVLEGKHAGIRIWHVRDFSSYLIAYRPHPAGVANERLFHARQGYQRVLQ